MSSQARKIQRSWYVTRYQEQQPTGKVVRVRMLKRSAPPLARMHHWTDKHITRFLDSQDKFKSELSKRNVAEVIPPATEPTP
jgi:hypothetical protein